MLEKILLAILGVFFLGICYFAYDIFSNSPGAILDVSIQGSEVAEKLSVSIPKYFDLAGNAVANISADDSQDTIKALTGNPGGNHAWLLNFYASQLKDKKNDAVKARFKELFEKLKTSEHSASINLIRVYRSYLETKDYELAVYFLEQSLRVIGALSTADFSQPYPMISENPTMFSVVILQEVLGVLDLLKDKDLVTKLQSDKNFNFNYDTAINNSKSVVTKMLKAITIKELDKATTGTTFFKSNKKYSSDACWVSLAYGSVLNSDVMPDDTSWYNNFISSMNSDFDVIDNTNLDLAQSLIPCLESATLNSEQWSKDLKTKITQIILNALYDSSNRKLCVGKELLLNIFPIFMNPNQELICNQLNYNIADNVWLSLLLKNDQNIYTLKKALEYNL